MKAAAFFGEKFTLYSAFRVSLSVCKKGVVHEELMFGRSRSRSFGITNIIKSSLAIDLASAWQGKNKRKKDKWLVWLEGIYTLYSVGVGK